MSRIDKLIADLCPEGVEFRTLKNLARRSKGTSITAARMKALSRPSGEIRVFAGGKTFADVDASAIPSGDVITTPSIIVRSRGNIDFTYYDKPFSHKSEIWSYSTSQPDVEQRFIYYYLTTLTSHLQEVARATSVKLPQLAVKDTDLLRIPVPPLEVQREIVRALDKFTQLEAELEAELEARRRQYEHYRHRLLNAVEGATVEIGSLGVWRSGLTPSKSNPTYWESGNIPWLASMDVSNESSKEIRGRVTQIALEKTSLRLIPAPSLAVVFRSNILRRVLPIRLVDTDTTVNQDIRALVPSDLVDIEYAYQALRANGEQLRQNCVRTDGSMAAIDAKTFFSWKVPLPELAEQRLIARKLRRFDSLVNDLSVGLSAELAARRKQYEYYRDRLLSFEEKR